MTTAALSPCTTAAIRASDADRDLALDLLRDHWLAGRLALEEYEARCAEAAGGRLITDLEQALRELPYPLPEHAARVQARAAAPVTSTPAHAGAALVSSVISVLCLLALVVSLGMLFVITVPASLGAWSLAGGARRSSSAAVRGLAVVGQTLAGLACTLSCLVVATWAIVLLA